MDIVGNIGKEEGERYYQIGQYPEAFSAHQQALVIAREVGAKPLEDIILEAIESLPKSEGPAQT